MEFLLLVGTIIAILIGVTSVIAAITTLVVIIQTIEDKEQLFLTIYALIGWFVIGMLVSSLIG